jgi:hypothetical protein
MKFLAQLALWATLAFVPCWWVSHAWQHALAGVAGRVLAPPGSTIEFQELELFYPFDVGIFLALCLASSWAAWARRLRAAALGVPVVVLVELASLIWAMKSQMGLLSAPAASDAAIDQTLRFANAVIRASGLVAAASVWLAVLGRERLSLASRRWLGS